MLKRGFLEGACACGRKRKNLENGVVFGVFWVLLLLQTLEFGLSCVESIINLYIFVFLITLLHLIKK